MLGRPLGFSPGKPVHQLIVCCAILPCASGFHGWMQCWMESFTQMVSTNQTYGNNNIETQCIKRNIFGEYIGYFAMFFVAGAEQLMCAIKASYFFLL